MGAIGAVVRENAKQGGARESVRYRQEFQLRAIAHRSYPAFCERIDSGWMPLPARGVSPATVERLLAAARGWPRRIEAVRALALSVSLPDPYVHAERALARLPEDSGQASLS
ncbi:hypothetical protein J2T57_001613 [Natronocella acetinitrilica]|uniref:Uncharacterized protein n=1 Tax=Natronocella acetinitrilica TaxID=414046 RepID=A0AAE3KBC7_9GAMM|nr:hypothetical protein [Natronocella acetinitrilica]MCP1674511.1 hypothetical protein [Natronocella acetinitrilica]